MDQSIDTTWGQGHPMKTTNAIVVALVSVISSITNILTRTRKEFDYCSDVSMLQTSKKLQTQNKF